MERSNPKGSQLEEEYNQLCATWVPPPPPSQMCCSWLEELQEAGGSAQAGKAGQSGRREEPVKASAAESGADAEYQFL